MKERLFEFATKGKWHEVVKTYKNDARAHKAKITRSGDTALHIAVTDGQVKIVEELVELVCKNAESTGALKIANERGNTPLHLAASMGSVRMCDCIARKDKVLVGARNHNGESPFFLAVLHGEKNAFLCLHEIGVTGQDDYTYCRRNNGDTILHCAIAGDNFDLAYHIIILYEELVNSVNEKGITPLHLLASKPFAFRSSSHFSWWSKIIYNCIFVDELKAEPSTETFGDNKNSKYPENYETCFNFVHLLQRIIRGVTSGMKGTTRKDGDAENPGSEHRRTSGMKGTTRRDGDAENPRSEHRGRHLFPSNYDTCFEYIKLLSKAMLVILGLGFTAIRKLKNKKEKHTWSVQIMNKLLPSPSTSYKYEYNRKSLHGQQSQPTPEADETTISDTNLEDKKGEGDLPEDQNMGKNGKGKKGEGMARFHNMTEHDLKLELKAKLIPTFADRIYQAGSISGSWVRLPAAGEKKSSDPSKKETPILIAAKNGIMEMVEKILEHFPVAIDDINSDEKNIVLLAVEKKQPDVYNLLLQRKNFSDRVFRIKDNKGNGALHLAAKSREHGPWLIPSPALQMQWDLKWYEYVKKSMPSHFFDPYNNAGETPEDIFTETHKELMENSCTWLSKISTSCSAVSGLIVTVAFATTASVPGGIEKGTPALEDQLAFKVFAISSFIALSCSVASAVAFLTILTSRYEFKDFREDLPWKLLVGFTSLLISVASMLVSFCAGHYFLIQDELKLPAIAVYIGASGFLTYFAINQFYLYLDVICANFRSVPQRRLNVDAL